VVTSVVVSFVVNTAAFRVPFVAAFITTSVAVNTVAN